MSTPEAVLKGLEDLGRQRAAKNSEIWESTGIASIDGFEHEGNYIWNPYMSECQRFEVDAYATYGEAYTEWLCKPLFPVSS